MNTTITLNPSTTLVTLEILPPTQILHGRDVPRDWSTRSDHVYIGRYFSDEHIGALGNPCRLRPDATAKECRRAYLYYQEYLAKRVKFDPAFREKVMNLHGKTLVCFCRSSRCHGKLLKETAERLCRNRRPEDPIRMTWA